MILANVSAFNCFQRVAQSTFEIRQPARLVVSSVSISLRSSAVSEQNTLKFQPANFGRSSSTVTEQCALSLFVTEAQWKRDMRRDEQRQQVERTYCSFEALIWKLN